MAAESDRRFNLVDYMRHIFLIVQNINLANAGDKRKEKDLLIRTETLDPPPHDNVKKTCHHTKCRKNL